MRRIERTGQFKRDYKREMKGRHRTALETVCAEILKKLVTKEWARNNFPVLHLIFSPSSSVLQSQNLEIEQLFLRFCSIRTNEYELNLSAKQGSYCAPIPNQPLAEKYWDHALTGDWKDHRDCHIKPDLVLIYRKPDGGVLQLVRLGSHSELGL